MGMFDLKGYFVDSNILIDIKKIMTGELNPSKSRYHRNYADLIDLVTSGKVEVLVVPTVLEEIKRGSHKDDGLTEMFIQRFCTICEFEDEELSLVDSLYEDYIYGDDDSVIPIFKEVGSTIKYNTKDARILAEVTVLYNGVKYDAIKFITNNIGDFINTDGVRDINREYGFKSVPFNSMRASNVKNEIR